MKKISSKKLEKAKLLEMEYDFYFDYFEKLESKSKLYIPDNIKEIDSSSYKLTIELVPSTCWFNNVRKILEKPDWDRIRKECAKHYKYKCGICRDSGLNQGWKWSVECHEVWEYDDINYIQKLKGLISLCPNCHKVKHSGLAQMQGFENLVLTQLMRVNKIPRDEAENYFHKSFEVWQQRSQYNWNLDVTYLDKFNLDIDWETYYMWAEFGH